MLWCRCFLSEIWRNSDFANGVLDSYHYFSIREGLQARPVPDKGSKSMIIRKMTIEDYDAVYGLWKRIKGFAMRSIDDSKEGVERFLLRNPDTSVVAWHEGRIVGAILCGHDGRRGCFYHVCVDPDYRMQGIGTKMVVFAMNALKKENISKVSLIAFTQNDVGNAFWRKIGWNQREDLNYYDFVLNRDNIEAFNQ